MTDQPAVAAIAEALNERIEDVIARLGLDGDFRGAEYTLLSTAQGGEWGDSFKIHVAGAKRGIWAHFGGVAPAGKRWCGGDGLDLVAYVLFDWDKGRALAWAKDFLGVEAADPAAIRATRRKAAARKAQAKNEAAKKRGVAQKIFLEAAPRLAGTPADLYLKGRGIDLSLLGRQPRALRFHPELWNAESNRNWPALVAAIHGPDGRFLAVHMTWLVGSNGGWIKVPGLEDQKMTLGLYAGGCIRLWRGASARPLRDAPAGDTATMSEGIEDGLTATLAKPAYRHLCAVSLGNMANIVLPEAIETLILLGQNDPATHPKRPGERHPARRQFAHAVRAQASRVRRVLVARPDAEQAHDINELLSPGAVRDGPGSPPAGAAPAAVADRASSSPTGERA